MPPPDDEPSEVAPEVELARVSMDDRGRLVIAMSESLGDPATVEQRLREARGAAARSPQERPPQLNLICFRF